MGKFTAIMQNLKIKIITMKIYYISGSTLPSRRANAVHVMKMCQSFATEGRHDVTLFGKGTGLKSAALFDFFGVAGDFKLVLSPYTKLPLIGGFIRTIFILFQAAKMGRPDLYYGRDALTLALLSGGDIPVYYEAHQMPSRPIDHWAVATLLKSKALRGVVVISEGLKQDFTHKYPNFDRARVIVAHDGADLFTKTTPLEKWPGRANVPQIGYAGSLHKGRGINLIQQIAERLPEMDFHIVGGSERDLQFWKKQVIPPNFHMHGFVKHASLPAYFEKFDILLAPYQTKIGIENGGDISRWISPMKLFEYMASGKPILSSDLPVLREILTTGENAGLLPPDQPGAWVDALCYLAKDKALGSALGARAKQDLETHYLWSIRARRILDFIAETKEKTPGK